MTPSSYNSYIMICTKKIEHVKQCLKIWLKQIDKVDTLIKHRHDVRKWLKLYSDAIRYARNSTLLWEIFYALLFYMRYLRLDSVEPGCYIKAFNLWFSYGQIWAQTTDRELDRQTDKQIER